MADNPSSERWALQVGEDMGSDVTVEFTLSRVSPAVWKAESITGLACTGASAEQAIGFLLAAVGNEMIEQWVAGIRSKEIVDGTRRMVGNEVTSEQLRDTYLGSKTIEPEQES